MSLHNTRGERGASRRRQPQGLGEWAPPAPPPLLRLQPPPAAAECRHEERRLPSPRPRSRAQGCTSVVPEQWRRLSRVQGPVTAVGLRRRRGRSQRPPPPTGEAAESSSPRVATRRGARDGCRDGAARRRTGGDDQGEGSGRSDPNQEPGPVSALGSRAPSEAHVHPWLIPMAVSCCSCSCPTFLVCPAGPVRLVLTAPPPRRNAPPLPAAPPRPPRAEAMGPAAARHRCGKLRGMGNEQLRGKRRGRRFLDRRLDSSFALVRPRLRPPAAPPAPQRPMCLPCRAHLNLDANT